MKRILILVVALSLSAWAQEQGNVMFRTAHPGSSIEFQTFDRGADAVVENAPYTATLTTKSVQALADGNRIEQSTTGSVARDTQGRTRRDMPLPMIGNLSATEAPHIVMIHDPVSKISYTLDLTNKTAQKMPPPSEVIAPASLGKSAANQRVVADKTFFIATRSAGTPLPPPTAFTFDTDDHAQVKVDDLGSQTMEGVTVNGTRTTRTIPAGEIGNEKPIEIVTEVWVSPELKTIVYSKRSDPRTGEQTFQLTNINRSEPDPSLFAVPSDFKIMQSQEPIIYRRIQ